MPIQNGKDTLLGQNTGSVPNMSETLYSWFQKMVFTKVVKTVVNFKNVEARTDINFQGVWQPLSDRQLEMMPIGQRKWRWFWVHAETNLKLDPDEVITYLGIQYRVKGDGDYTEYGYVSYKLVEDYEGSGP